MKKMIAPAMILEFPAIYCHLDRGIVQVLLAVFFKVLLDSQKVIYCVITYEYLVSFECSRHVMHVLLLYIHTMVTRM